MAKAPHAAPCYCRDCRAYLASISDAPENAPGDDERPVSREAGLAHARRLLAESRAHAQGKLRRFPSPSPRSTGR
jgi:hypothetical protein